MTVADIEAVAVAVVFFAGCLAVLYRLPSSRRVQPLARLAAFVVVAFVVLVAGGLGQVVDRRVELNRPPDASEVQP